MSLNDKIQSFLQKFSCDQCYLMCSRATGDIPHLLAALQQNPKAAVVIYDWKAHKASQRCTTLNQFGVKSERILVLEENLFNATEKTAERDTEIKNIWKLYSAVKTSQLGDTTKAGYEYMRSGNTKDLRHALRGVRELTEDDKPLVDFWASKEVPTSKNVVVLWGRWSGKGSVQKFGAHPYGDSGNQANIQLAKYCIERDLFVIAAGDVKNPGDVPELSPGSFLHIGFFWNEFNPRLTNFQQVRLFFLLRFFLKEQNNRLVHVGMRSGNLDYYAYSGQPVVYMLPSGIGNARMKDLNKLDDSPWQFLFLKKAPKASMSLSKDWTNIVKQTNLKELLIEGSDLERAVKKYSDTFPLSVEEELLAKVLYNEIKNAKKNGQKSLLDDNSQAQQQIGTLTADLTRLYDKTRKDRGYAKEDLGAIFTRIQAALNKRKSVPTGIDGKGEKESTLS